MQETADGQVVVFHDSDFMKLAGVDRKIWDATLADLQDIDIGGWFAPEFKRRTRPHAGRGAGSVPGQSPVDIELKYYGHEQQLEQRVVDIVEAHGMAADVVIMSLKIAGVQKMKALRPDWKIGLLMSVSAGDVNKSGVDFIAVNAAFATRRFIKSAHASGQKVYAWTVNDPTTMSTLIGRGIDGLITDKPALARSVLAQRARTESARTAAARVGRVPRRDAGSRAWHDLRRPSAMNPITWTTGRPVLTPSSMPGSSSGCCFPWRCSTISTGRCWPR